MGTVLVIAGFGFLFALFALLGPAERSKPCGGRRSGQKACDQCPLEEPGGGRSGWNECPGTEAISKEE